MLVLLKANAALNRYDRKCNSGDLISNRVSGLALLVDV